MIFGISKTTLAGILSFLIATLTTLTAFQVPAALTPNASRVWLYVTIGANLLVSLCRVWVGLLQGDALPNTPPLPNPTPQPSPGQNSSANSADVTQKKGN